MEAVLSGAGEIGKSILKDSKYKVLEVGARNVTGDTFRDKFKNAFYTGNGRWQEIMYEAFMYICDL